MVVVGLLGPQPPEARLGRGRAVRRSGQPRTHAVLQARAPQQGEAPGQVEKQRRHHCRGDALRQADADQALPHPAMAQATVKKTKNQRTGLTQGQTHPRGGSAASPDQSPAEERKEATLKPARSSSSKRRTVSPFSLAMRSERATRATTTPASAANLATTIPQERIYQTAVAAASLQPPWQANGKAGRAQNTRPLPAHSACRGEGDLGPAVNLQLAGFVGPRGHQLTEQLEEARTCRDLGNQLAGAPLSHTSVPTGPPLDVDVLGWGQPGEQTAASLSWSE